MNFFYVLGLIVQQLVLNGIPIGCCTRCSVSCRLVSIRHWHWIEMTKHFGGTGLLTQKYAMSLSLLPQLYLDQDMYRSRWWRGWHEGKQGWKWGKWQGFLFCFLVFVCFPGFILAASPVQGKDVEPHIKAYVTNVISLPSVTLTHGSQRVKVMSHCYDLAIFLWLYVPMLHAV